MRTAFVLLLTVLPVYARTASAACCRVIRIDPETPIPVVRVCDPDASGNCGTVLFEGTMEVGVSHQVCGAGPVVMYQDYDASAGTYGPPTEARCDGGDVEL